MDTEEGTPDLLEFGLGFYLVSIPTGHFSIQSLTLMLGSCVSTCAQNSENVWDAAASNSEQKKKKKRMKWKNSNCQLNTQNS